MPSIKKEYFIEVPRQILWDALTDPKQLDAWGAGPDPVVELEDGGTFSLWGGDIHGKVLEVEKGYRIVQEWHTSGHDYPTEVTISLKDGEFEGDAGTDLTIIQADVHDEDMDEFDRGWDEFFVGPLKEHCEQVM